MKIPVTVRQMAVLECFSSESRVRIIELLNRKPMNVKELAEALGVSSAIVTKHVQKLEEAGIIRTESLSGARGRQKVCHLRLDSITLLLKTPEEGSSNRYAASIPVGHYTAYEAKPTCGLASRTKIIGMLDDPRYFSDPEHVEAAHLWLGSGFVEYRVPNYLLSGQRALGVTVTLELCSEAPGYNVNWPSDIYFYLNDVPLGFWTCPGDFGGAPGAHTPAWWKYGTTHGLLKSIRLRHDGCFIDGVRMSPVTLGEVPIVYGEELRFRIAAPESARHAGGLSLFGKGFGNYDRDIEVTVEYE
ncbi:ArsR/SmtB family transcription factor [Cohnella massiliensis]|uniref:ArsR/SmtB family transcription factor n=1 Tax=Cohnella massiliensis TaxID=1816691 RepID=UPI0009BB7E9D|nr:ArsR family transcriptional regulator [Cohnella massiliensis]